MVRYDWSKVLVVKYCLNFVHKCITWFWINYLTFKISHSICNKWKKQRWLLPWHLMNNSNIMFKTFIYIAGYELFLHFDVFFKWSMPCLLWNGPNGYNFRFLGMHLKWSSYQLMSKNIIYRPIPSTFFVLQLSQMGCKV